MNRFVRLVLAVCAFLAALAVGAFGGCTVGLVTAFSQPQPAHANDNTFYALIYAGAAVGLVMGVVIARLILKPPAPPLPRRDNEEPVP